MKEEVPAFEGMALCLQRWGIKSEFKGIGVDLESMTVQLEACFGATGSMFWPKWEGCRVYRQLSWDLGNLL